MKFHAQNLPTTGDAVVLALELLDRGLSVAIDWSEEKHWVVAAMDLESKRDQAPTLPQPVYPFTHPYFQTPYWWYP